MYKDFSKFKNKKTIQLKTEQKFGTGHFTEVVRTADMPVETVN